MTLSPVVHLWNQEATWAVMSLGRPRLPPPVLQDPVGLCGILQLQRPRPVGPPCLLARGLTRTEGPLSGPSSRRDSSGPALLTLPRGLPPAPREAALHVLCSQRFLTEGPTASRLHGGGVALHCPLSWGLLPWCPPRCVSRKSAWELCVSCSGPGPPLLTRPSLTFSLGRRYSGLQLLRGHTGRVHPQPGSGEGVQEARDR